jgi:hypothetical protein
VTKKQFNKALSTRPPQAQKTVTAQDKFNKYLDRNPDALRIVQAYQHALDIIMESADGDLMDGQYTALIPNTKLGEKFKSDVRNAVVQAYSAGLV